MTGSGDKAAALVVAIIAVAAIGGGSWWLYRRMHPRPLATVFPDADGNCPRGYHYQKEGFGGPYTTPICCPPGTACD